MYPLQRAGSSNLSLPVSTKPNLSYKERGINSHLKIQTDQFSGRFRQNSNDPTASSDMDEYISQIEKQRFSNSLTIRKANTVKTFLTPKFASAFLASPRFELSEFLEIFSNNNSQKIIETSDEIVKLVDSNPESISNIIHSNEAIESITNSLAFSEDEQVKKSLFISIASIFPLCGPKQILIVDNLYLHFYSFFESATSSTILHLIHLTIVISFSSYGRNSLISAGVYELLISLALQNDDHDITVNCCLALESIFKNAENSDCEIIVNNGNVANILKLGYLPYIEAKSALFSIISSIASQTPIVLNLVCQLNKLHLFLLTATENEYLQDQSLRLLTKISRSADISYFKEMIEHGFIDILLRLLQTEKCSSSLHILSFLIDRLTDDVVLRFVSQEFVDTVVDLALNSPFDIMKQAVFVIATISYKLGPSIVETLIKPDIVKLMVDMLDSDQNDIMLKCLLALLNMTRISVLCGKQKEFAESLNQTDIFDILSTLGENRLQTISDRALSLLKKLEPLLS